MAIGHLLAVDTLPRARPVSGRANPGWTRRGRRMARRHRGRSAAWNGSPANTRRPTGS